jgi:hypothetical protein
MAKASAVPTAESMSVFLKKKPALVKKPLNPWWSHTADGSHSFAGL